MPLIRPVLKRAANRLLTFEEECASDPGTCHNVRMLYLHIPFCPQLCPYCSFHRVRYDESLSKRYFQALRREMNSYAELGYQFTDIYVGGGTPTVNLKELSLTLEQARHSFPIRTISVETNPDHLVPEKLEVLQASGVSRLSVGVQSFDDGQLARMGRLDAYGDGDTIAARLGRTEGLFGTLNVDMMFNLPGQSLATVRQDIRRLLDTGVSQASFYPLMMSRSTTNSVRKEMGKFSFELEQDMYYAILDDMSPTHPPSSVWCFSRDRNEIDEYIVEHDQFVGIGSGAFSYLQGKFHATSFSILTYDQLLDRQSTGITRSRLLSKSEQRYYRLLTRLFGLNLSADDVQQLYAGEFPMLPESLRLLGLVEPREGGYRLNRRGMYYWLVLMSEFLTGVNNLRDQMRAHIKEEMLASYDDATPIIIP